MRGNINGNKISQPIVVYEVFFYLVPMVAFKPEHELYKQIFLHFCVLGIMIGISVCMLLHLLQEQMIYILNLNKMEVKLYISLCSFFSTGYNPSWTLIACGLTTLWLSTHYLVTMENINNIRDFWQESPDFGILHSIPYY